MATKGQKFQRYSEEVKKKAVQMHEELGKSYRAIAEEPRDTQHISSEAWVQKVPKSRIFRRSEK
jgi:transposase-like protein